MSTLYRIMATGYGTRDRMTYTRRAVFLVVARDESTAVDRGHQILDSAGGEPSWDVDARPVASPDDVCPDCGGENPG